MKKNVKTKVHKDELTDTLMNLRKQQYELRIQKANQNLVKTHLIQQVRREIARVKTKMTEQAGKEND